LSLIPYGFGNLVQSYISIDRFMLEGLAGDISLRIIEKVKFLPPPLFYNIIYKYIHLSLNSQKKFDNLRNGLKGSNT